MLVKICGNTHVENIKEIAALNPDMIGYIFYPASARLVVEREAIAQLNIPTSIKKVGVFVNASVADIIATANEFSLDFIQLHGNETPNICDSITSQGFLVIKVISVGKQIDTESLVAYLPFVSYFLFDTATESYGGSGQKFDWSLLQEYNLSKPFILSGGIGIEDVPKILSLKIEQLSGIDINSKFEIEPGVKDIGQVKKILKLIKDAKI